MKLLGIVSVGFDVRDQLLIGYFAFMIYWRKNKSTLRQYISFRKAYDSTKREVLYDIITELGYP
jgi:hypothetical protein